MSRGHLLAARGEPKKTNRQCAFSLAVHPGNTVASARAALARAFRQAGLDTPELDARILLQFVLALDLTGLASNPERKISSAESERIRAAAMRRLRREPVAHIVGAKEFWGLPLRVTADTLIPRPETEIVIAAALAAVERTGPRTRALRIADLGTGSGALLLALLSELPQAYGVGTDRSQPALAVARENAVRLGLATRAAFVACDFAAALDEGFDLIVSNPPYIETGAIEALASEVRDHEPRLALDGGVDGLAAYRTLAMQTRRVLAAGAPLIVEIGYAQAQAVTTLFARTGFDRAGEPWFDLAGIPRGLILQRH